MAAGPSPQAPGPVTNTPSPVTNIPCLFLTLVDSRDNKISFSLAGVHLDLDVVKLDLLVAAQLLLVLAQLRLRPVVEVGPPHELGLGVEDDQRRVRQCF